MIHPPHDRSILRVGVEDDVDKSGLTPGFSKNIQQRLRRAFTPKGMDFFDFYGLLKSINRGYPVPDNLRMKFRRAANRLNQVTSPADGKSISPEITNQIAELQSDLNLYFNRLNLYGELRPSHWRMLNELVVPLIIAVARDKGVYLKALQRGPERWAIFRPMTKKQERVEKMRDTDPETYALLQRYHTTLENIDKAIKEDIQDRGLIPEEGFMMGRPVIYGVDPRTKERLIYDRDGDVLTRDEYKAKRRAQKRADARLSLVSTRTDVPLSKMRKLTDEEVDNLEGDVEWSALTDDVAKQGKLSRIFPTKKTLVPIKDEEGNVIRYEGVNVIVGGRYKGIFLDDMVNGLGRMIEGTAYTYSPLTGRKGMAPKRIDPSQREPYTTVATVTEKKEIQGKVVSLKKKKLFLRISGQRADKELRRAIKSLACNVPNPKGNCIPSISYHKVPGSRAAEFYFDPKDFATIMDNLTGMSLSQSAMDLMEDYNRDQAYADKAITDQNLRHYSADAIGGFVQVKYNPIKERKAKFDLLTKQKQALAWLEANGGKGVCALDTGVGKTLTTIAMMRKQIRDGVAEEGASYVTPDGKEVETNGRFLYVCPKELRGNLPSQMRGFLRDGHDLERRVDILSYRQFGMSQSTGKIPPVLRRKPFWKDRTRFDAKFYVSIYFDEAHNLKGKTQASKAAFSLWHPRKVCLTASPMDKEPMEAYILASISNNVRTFTLPGDSEDQIQAVKEARDEKRRFKNRYCEIVGGDVVGVKEDPIVKRELDQWVKRNVFYAEKTAIEEFELDEPTRTSVAVEMNPVVENAYRTLANQFSKTMLGVAKKWKARGGAGTSGEAVQRFAQTEFRPVLRIMRDLSNRPQKALYDIAQMIDTDKMPNGKPIPEILRRVVVKWREVASSNELREAANSMENSKLVVTEDILSQKFSETERGPNPSRAILFTDDPEFCMEAIRFLSQKIGGKTAVALKDNIYIYEGTSPLTELYFEQIPSMGNRLVNEKKRKEFEESGGRSVIPLPLRKKAYKRHSLVRSNDTDNIYYKPNDWQQFAFQEVISPDPGIKVVVLLGTEYSYGHNLQAFDTVIHLDRDGWQSETMKQRIARAWRQGQRNPVDEFTLDATYSADRGPLDEYDVTLDQIGQAIQQVGKEVFDAIMLESLDTDLGGKWGEMVQRDASLVNLDQKVNDLMLSPYIGRSEPPGAI